MFFLHSCVGAGSVFLPGTSAFRAFASRRGEADRAPGGTQAEPLLPAPTFAVSSAPEPVEPAVSGSTSASFFLPGRTFDNALLAPGLRWIKLPSGLVTRSR